MSGLSRFSTVVFQVTAGHRYGGRGFLRCCADLAGARGRRVCTVLWLWVMSVLGGCGIARSEQEVPPVYTADVEDLLLRRCGACHGAEPGASAAAGYRVGSYGQVLACSTLSPDQSVVLPYTADAPILKVFEWSAEHVGLLEQAEAERLQAWVLAGAPLTAGGCTVRTLYHCWWRLRKKRNMGCISFRGIEHLTKRRATKTHCTYIYIYV